MWHAQAYANAIFGEPIESVCGHNLSEFLTSCSRGGTASIPSQISSGRHRSHPSPRLFSIARQGERREF